MATKKVSVVNPRKAGRSVTDENVKARIDEQHEKKLEVIRQFRAEHEKNEEIEKSLQKMQLLSFEPVDYEYLLEAEPWVEPPRTSYEHIKVEAVQRVEVMYKDRLMLYACIFAASFLLYLLFSRPLALAFFLAAGFFLVYQISRTLKQKQTDLINALEEAQQEIYEKQKEELKLIEEARKQHEFSQQLRQEEHQSIMEGKPETVGQMIKEKLEEFPLPVNFEATVEINGPLVNASIVLPDLSVIPKRRTRLLPTGYLEYDDKQDREVYKQYSDLVISLLLHVSVRIIEIAPTVSTVYTRGSNDDGELLLYLELQRNQLSKAGKRLVMSQLLKDSGMLYSVDIDYRLLPVEDSGPPQEWDESQPTYKIAVKVLKSSI